MEKSGQVFLPFRETVRCREHPAGGDETAPTAEPEAVEDGGHPGMGGDWGLGSTHNLEVPAHLLPLSTGELWDTKQHF